MERRRVPTHTQQLNPRGTRTHRVPPPTPTPPRQERMEELWKILSTGLGDLPLVASRARVARFRGMVAVPLTPMWRIALCGFVTGRVIPTSA